MVIQVRPFRIYKFLMELDLFGFDFETAGYHVRMLLKNFVFEW